MRGFIAFLLTALLSVELVNCWQIRQLQAQVDTLQHRVQKAEAADSSTTALNTALALLAQAREAMKDADYEKARALLAETTARANQIGHTVGDKAAPAAAWLRQQARMLEDQIDRK